MSGDPIMDEFAGRARAWLRRAYGDAVVLAEPIRETGRTVLFGCHYATAREPMLAATVCVPADGRSPFPVANSAPLDEDLNLDRFVDAEEPWRWRANARNCVVAADAAMDGAPATACAWQPGDESPGWWERMLSRYFPGADVATCVSWSEAGAAVVDGGPGSRAVVWLRRQLDGRELTGHLLYLRYDEERDQVIAFDPQSGGLASVSEHEVGELVVARFRRAVVTPAPHVVPGWEEAADDFPAAVTKAGDWLTSRYGDEVRLVAPNPADEMRRGWLFACTTARFLETGDWRDQMLDAALVVPKAGGEVPFGLPNRDPWTWLRQWDAGVTGLSAPPAPPRRGVCAWYGSVSQRVGELSGVRGHRHWGGVLAEVGGLPVGTLALIWLRRKDGRDRETVGHLVWAVNRGSEIDIIDPTADGDSPPVDSDPFELKVFRLAKITNSKYEKVPSLGRFIY